MFTLIFLFLLSIILLVLAYLIRYKKRYNLIAGYTDYNKNDEEKVKFKANLIADCTFFFSFLLVIFSILNLFVDWFKSINEELDGMFIILISLLITLLFCVFLYFFKLFNLKNK